MLADARTRGGIGAEVWAFTDARHPVYDRVEGCIRHARDLGWADSLDDFAIYKRLAQLAAISEALRFRLLSWTPADALPPLNSSGSGK